MSSRSSDVFKRQNCVSDLGDVGLIIVECLCVGCDASDAHTISSTRTYRDKGCLKAAGLPRELE
jgi:hypothetical protein